MKSGRLSVKAKMKMRQSCERNLFVLMINLAVGILFARIFVFAQKYDNSEQELNDPCSLPESTGICKMLIDCEPVKNLIKESKSSKIVHCRFQGKYAPVCCPRKSKKFENALCKDKQPPPQQDLKLEDHITLGIRAEVREFPYQVAIAANNINNETEFICGGSLIADDIVLTAAHCGNRKDLMPTFVRLGRTSLNISDSDDDSKHQDIKVKQIELHPSYRIKIKQHDIALIKLETPATIGEGTEVNTICLSTRSDVEDKNFTVTGFGTIEGGSSTKRSDWLLKAYVQKFELKKCQEMYKTAIETARKDIIDSQFCAFSSKGQDTCQGDSGGPMMYEIDRIRYLFGVTSYGAGCGSTTFPSIYTRVDKYLDWIEAAMAKLEY